MKNIKYLLYGAGFVFKTKIQRRDLPFIAGLVVGDSCNLNCQHCSVNSKDRLNDLSFDEIDSGLRLLYGKGIRLLAITGGEPFYWKDGDKNLNDIISLARNIGFMITSVYTNGTLELNSEADDLFVSIDGLKDTSSKLRGGDYEKVIKNIKESAHPNIIVNCTINNKNKNEVEALCEYLSGIENVKGISFYFHTPYYGKDDLYISLEERQKSIKQILSLKKKYNIVNSEAALWDVYHNRWKRPSGLCLVYAHNKVYKCCREVGNEEACRDCGYMGYPEIINLVNLKFSAIRAAFNYFPGKKGGIIENY
ncbi:MAG: radical SAM protein [Spirochaetales bacterium]|nr:radical SAM protein [Spirochaetales bacterium]